MEIRGKYPNRYPHDTKGTIEGQRPVGPPEFPSPLYSLFSFSTLGLSPPVPTLTLSPPPEMMESSADWEGSNPLSRGRSINYLPPLNPYIPQMPQWMNCKKRTVWRRLPYQTIDVTICREILRSYRKRSWQQMFHPPIGRGWICSRPIGGVWGRGVRGERRGGQVRSV